MAFTGIGSAEIFVNGTQNLTETVTTTVPDLSANSIGWVWAITNSGTTNPTGVTWGGTAMTLAVSSTETGRNVYGYYLVNPPDNGSKNIVVTYANTDIKSVHITAAWANAGATVTLDDISSATGTTQNPTITSTQAGTNELVTSASGSAANGLGSPTTTNCTELQSHAGFGNSYLSAYSIPASSGDTTHQHNRSQVEAYAIASMSFQESGGSPVTVSASTGIINASGQQATINAPIITTATTGIVNLAGITATIVANTTINAATGVIAVLGQTATVSAPTTITATVGVIAVSGQLATIVANTTIPAIAGNIFITGQQTTIIAPIVTAASAGIINFVGQTATLIIPTLTQASFRFYNDDGTESAATPAQSEDTNISWPLDSNIRLRIQVDALHDPNAAQYTLEYREVGSGDPWISVPVGPSGDAVLQADGSYVLLIDGSYLLLEN